MWKVGAAAVVAVAAVLLILLGTQLWPRDHRAAVQPPRRAAVQPLSRAAAWRCAKKVLNDWIDDARIEGDYRPACYRTALNRGFSADTNCDLLYGGGSLCEDLKAGVRSGTSAGG